MRCGRRLVGLRKKFVCVLLFDGKWLAGSDLQYMQAQSLIRSPLSRPFPSLHFVRLWHLWALWDWRVLLPFFRSPYHFPYYKTLSYYKHTLIARPTHSFIIHQKSNKIGIRNNWFPLDTALLTFFTSCLTSVFTKLLLLSNQYAIRPHHFTISLNNQICVCPFST